MGLPVVLSLATMCCEVYDDNSVAVISLITLLCDGSSSVVLVLLSSLLCVLSVRTVQWSVCVVASKLRVVTIIQSLSKKHTHTHTNIHCRPTHCRHTHTYTLFFISSHCPENCHSHTIELQYPYTLTPVI